VRDAAFGLLALLAVGAADDGARAPASAVRAIVPDNGGPLREVVLHFEPRTEAAVAPAYRDLTRAFEPSTKIWVVVERREHFERFLALARRWSPRLDARRLRPVLVGAPITTWSRDRYSLLEGGGRRTLLVRVRPGQAVEERRNDWLAPFALARAAGPGVRVEVAPLVFDGGDLVATDRFVLATAVLAWRNRNGALGDPARLGPYLRRVTGREPVLLGRRLAEVPIHHICMIATPLDDRRVLVGDARAGVALLPPGARLPRAVEQRLAELRKFDAVADALAARSFRVIRVPLVPLVDRLTYVSYQNALLERRADGRLHAYLPQYGLAALDAAGRSAYERAGVVVHPIDVSSVYGHTGAVRCLVNVLARGPVPPHSRPYGGSRLR
jgi:hypothetical protein